MVRDYLYVGDAVDAMIKSIDYTGEERIFNIGSGQRLSLNEIKSVLFLVLFAFGRIELKIHGIFIIPLGGVMQ